MSGLRNQDSSGLMAELVFYVALSRAYLDLRGEIQMQLWPKGSYPAANGIDWETDCQMVLRGENFPVDVSNSIQHMMTTYDKVQRAMQVKNAGLSNPVLINRMSSGDVKGLYMRWNSSVSDFGKLIILDNETTEVTRHSARALEMERFVNWVPPLEIGDTYLTGQSYDELIHERPRGIPRFGPEVFAEAAGQIPHEIVERARGLVEFLWVNGYYRQARTTEERISSLVFQWAFWYLLRSDTRVDVQTLFDYSIGRMRPPYLAILQESVDDFFSTFQNMLGVLQDLGFCNITNREASRLNARFPMIGFGLD